MSKNASTVTISTIKVLNILLVFWHQSFFICVHLFDGLLVISPAVINWAFWFGSQSCLWYCKLPVNWFTYTSCFHILYFFRVHFLLNIVITPILQVAVVQCHVSKIKSNMAWKHNSFEFFLVFSVSQGTRVLWTPSWQSYFLWPHTYFSKGNFLWPLIF